MGPRQADRFRDPSGPARRVFGNQRGSIQDRARLHPKLGLAWPPEDQLGEDLAVREPVRLQSVIGQQDRKLLRLRNGPHRVLQGGQRRGREDDVCQPQTRSVPSTSTMAVAIGPRLTLSPTVADAATPAAGGLMDPSLPLHLLSVLCVPW
jgi:hypothetical protein